LSWLRNLPYLFLFMLRSFCFALLGLGLLAAPAMAQTTPAKAKASTSSSAKTKAAATMRRTNRLNDAVESDKGQSGYAAPGEPITAPGSNGKNTPPYDGPAAPTKKGTTLATPK
jgi:hypothetical protein